MSWTQPMCDDCWTDSQDTRQPFRMQQPFVELETCAWCGRETTSGIYVRADPRELPHPTQEDD